MTTSRQNRGNFIKGTGALADKLLYIYIYIHSDNKPFIFCFDIVQDDERDDKKVQPPHG